MSFTFNSINSDTMGLIVERYPSRPFPTRKAESYPIVGRSGDLVVDQNAWSNVTQEYDVFVNGNFQQNAQAIAYWLLNASGYCTLTDSYDSASTYRMARFIGGVSFLNALNKYGKATITFDCCPQRYPITAEELTGTANETYTFPIHANMMDGSPMINILTWVSNASGTIVDSNGMTITIPAQGSAINSIFVDYATHSVGTTDMTLNGRKKLTGVTVSGNAANLWKPIGDGGTITLAASNAGNATVRINTRRWYL